MAPGCRSSNGGTFGVNINLVNPYYQDSAVTIYHADCRDIITDLGRFDLLLTDPPYGINASRHRNSQANGWKDYGSVDESKWDLEPVSLALMEAFIDKVKVAQIWGGNYYHLRPSMGWLIWDKGQRDFSLADCELCWTSENRATRIYTMSRSVALLEGKQHPTQETCRFVLVVYRQGVDRRREHT